MVFHRVQTMLTKSGKKPACFSSSVQETIKVKEKWKKLDANCNKEQNGHKEK